MSRHMSDALKKVIKAWQNGADLKDAWQRAGKPTTWKDVVRAAKLAPPPKRRASANAQPATVEPAAKVPWTKPPPSTAITAAGITARRGCSA